MNTNIKTEKVNHFSHRNINFDNQEELIRVYKTDPKVTRESHIDALELELPFDNEDSKIAKELFAETKKSLQELWDKLEPFTIKEVFQTYQSNSEKLMVLLSLFDPEDVIKDLDAVLIDKQTVTKTQVIDKVKGLTNIPKEQISSVKLSDITHEEFTYDDTYELYKVKAKTINAPDDVFYVKCKDTFSDRVYYLPVNENDDALDAIASIHRDEYGNPLKKEEYLTMKAER